MTIELAVPVPTDWDDVRPGDLLQAAHGESPVLCMKVAGDRPGVLVLKSPAWTTAPSLTTFDALDGPPLRLPGVYAVEVVPGPGGD